MDVPEKPLEGKDTAAPRCATNEGEVNETGAFAFYLRIFRYATTTEQLMQGTATICAIASGTGMAMVNLVFGEFITVITENTQGRYTPSEFRQRTGQLALYFFVIGIGRFILCYLYSLLFKLAAHRITRNIRMAYLSAGLRQEIAFSDSAAAGSIATQATTNGQLIQTGISEKLGLVIQSLASIVAAFILAMTASWKLTLITGCIIPAALCAMTVASYLDAQIEVQILGNTAQAASFIESVLGSARTIHAFALRQCLMKDLDSFLKTSARISRKKRAIMGCWFSNDYFILYAGTGLCFWQAMRMLGQGEIQDPGTIFVVLMSIIVAASSLTAISPSMLDFTRAATCAGEMFKLIDRKSLLDPLDQAGESPADVMAEIDLCDVCFSYPSRPDVTVLDNFSLHVPAGKSTALVGASGSGKSTIVALLERWYTPSSGSVKIDGKPIETFNLRWLRKQIRIVQQDPVLFSGTIYDNIANGLVGTPWEHESPDLKFIRIKQAAENAFAHEFISKLPLGYNTIIGERGGSLSGGQKQRIAIARSIISQPPILLLDEATSALDPESEQLVQQALDRVSEGRTTIAIAHRLATIQSADNIVVVDKGRVVEQGTHASLLKLDGFYARLVKAQDLTAVKLENAASEDSFPFDPKEADVETPQLCKTLTRRSTAPGHVVQQADTGDFSNAPRIGILRTILRLLCQSSEFRWHYLLLGCACIAAAAAYPGQAMLMSQFIDVFQGSNSEMQRNGNFLALMFFILGIGSAAAYFAVGWLSTAVATGLNNKFRRQVVNDILRQDVQFFDRPENATGALTSRADSYPAAIYVLMGYNVALIFLAVVSMLSCSILSIVYAWKLGLLVTLAGLPPLAAAGYVRIRMEGFMDAQSSEKLATSASIASEAINGIRTVSMLCLEEQTLAKYRQELDLGNSGSTRTVLVMMAPFAFTQTVDYFFLALGFWYGCRLLSFGELTMLEFFVSFLAVYFSGQKASMIFASCTSITTAVNAANYIFWLSQLQPTICETKPTQSTKPTGHRRLDLNEIYFSYPQRPDIRVLRGINLAIDRAQFVALVGASGCGKSTVISIVERFYDPTNGSLEVDGTDAKHLDPWLYRQDVALVQQEPVVYSGTIRHNIAMGVAFKTDSTANVPEADIIKACRQANAWEFISSLPEGLNTNCGANGTQLSGGQRQRIAIARALIRNPRVLLLDEATSALDTQSERVVQEALNEAAASDQRITIAVAHRLSTIRHANLICVFHRGLIVERGTHEQLISKGGIYKKMCESQTLGI